MMELPPRPQDRLEWIMSALQVIHHNVGRIAMSTDDLSAAVTRTEAATTAALAAINTEIEQLAQTPDNAVIAARLNANADRIEAAVASLAADDTNP